jgi:hypothetical protein
MSEFRDLDLTTPDTRAHRDDAAEGLYEVPCHLELIPGGQEGLVLGDIEGRKLETHVQGANRYGFEGTCGLVSCEGILRHFGLNLTEQDVVQHALEHRECFYVPGDATKSGGTIPEMQAQVLRDFGIPAHVETLRSLGDLTTYLQEGRGIILGVNAGMLWNNPNAWETGQANHAVVLTGVVVSPDTGQLLGFSINDSATGAAGQFVDATRLYHAWGATGGECVITDVVR